MSCAWLCATAVPAVALAVASLIDVPPRLVFNASQSAPIGFYWVADEPANRGDYVLVRVPERVQNLVETRRYLPPGMPMIKRVAGINGDLICRREQEILVNSVTVAIAKRVDSASRKMPMWTGCHVLRWRQVFLLQDHPKSFDGRYFGSVDRCLIIGRARHLRFPWQKG